MKAKELMSVPPVSVGADATLTEIIRLISSRQISSVPVVGNDGQVIGIISWYELLPRTKNIRTPELRAPVVFKQITDINRVLESYRQSTHLTARDIMSPSPVCVDVDDPIEQIVWTMVEKNVHMLPVLSSGSLAGVLTRSDFIRFLAQEL